MRWIDRSVKWSLLAIAVFLGTIAVRAFLDPAGTVLAQTPRFDHVYVVSPMYLYKGQQGLLVMDKRNGNVWVIPKEVDNNQNPVFKPPVFIVRVPFESLDEAPR